MNLTEPELNYIALTTCSVELTFLLHFLVTSWCQVILVVGLAQRPLRSITMFSHKKFFSECVTTPLHFIMMLVHWPIGYVWCNSPSLMMGDHVMAAKIETAILMHLSLSVCVIMPVKPRGAWYGFINTMNFL